MASSLPCTSPLALRLAHPPPIPSPHALLFPKADPVCPLRSSCPYAIWDGQAFSSWAFCLCLVFPNVAERLRAGTCSSVHGIWQNKNQKKPAAGDGLQQHTPQLDGWPTWAKVRQYHHSSEVPVSVTRPGSAPALLSDKAQWVTSDLQVPKSSGYPTWPPCSISPNSSSLPLE